MQFYYIIFFKYIFIFIYKNFLLINSIFNYNYFILIYILYIFYVFFIYVFIIFYINKLIYLKVRLINR